MNANIISLAERVVIGGVSLFVQSTLVILAGLLIAWLCRRRGPALESVILRTTLLAMILCPLGSVALSRMGIAGRSLVLPAVHAPAASVPLTLSSVPATVPAPATAAVPVRQGTEGTKVTPGTAAKGTGMVQTVRAVEPAPRRQREGALPGMSGPALAYLLLAGTWVLGGGCLLLRLLVSYRSIRRMLRESDLADVRIFESCSAIAGELAVTPPEVRVHAEIKSPLLMGWARPAILLPHVEGMEDLVATREVLLHELAHRARGDCGWHLATRTVTALLWFQPLLWLLARRIEETAEDVCDNYVIEHGGDRRGYAQQLVALAEQLQFSAAESLAGTGVIAFRSALGRRVVRILDASRNLSRRVDFRAWVGPATAMVVTTAVIGLVGVKAAEMVKLPASGTALRILAAGTNWEPYGVLSPDEKKIAYIDWDTTEDANIMVKDLTTGAVQNLTKADPKDGSYDFADDSGVWSPDSRSIAFGWYSGQKAPNQTYEVRIASVVDGGVRVLVPDTSKAKTEFDYSPIEWSHDGRTLLCERYQGDFTQALVAISVETGQVTQLLSLQWNRAHHARFSPDDRYVVFDRTVDDNQDIYLMDVAGHQLVRLTDSSQNDSKPVWSADGKTVLYSSDVRGSWDLWGLQVENGKAVGNPFLVRHNFGDHVKWTTQAGNLAFIAVYNETDGYYVDVNPRGPVRVSTPKPIARASQGHNWSPTWSPDGTKVAFARDRKMLAVQSLATGTEEVFRAGGMWWISNLIWSPDGKWMAVYPRGPKGNGLHMFNLETRELRAFPDVMRIDLIGWSPDSREFRYVDYTTNPAKYRALALSDGAKRELTLPEVPAAAAYFDVSPDQRRVVYALQQSSGEVDLIVAERGTGGSKVIAHLGKLPKINLRPAGNVRPKWSPDGTAIAYYGLQESPWGRSQATALHVVAADGSWNEAINIGSLRHANYSQKPAEWSKDGSKLAMTLAAKDRGEIGVLANFLPTELVAAR